ncbi:GNAT family N-acetyltransferase [Streptomyces sp. NBC_01565]|uniref:GNAT family N-acetyltransferase n=1 Tax=unclassified Streptomyces TaxID=2593676 RepID=UPI0022563625|nr:GNAT family N-acetyltransferase [Streptomyces sp. NBC_01565]MCX4539396.1 GNAT family N-acetyltransferase [Streptomyces sp. NBC_01565]
MTFDVQRLGPADLGLLLELQDRIRSTLPDPSVFQTSTPEFIAYCLADGGRCYRVVHEGESVAYRMVYFPRDRDFNLAKDTTLPPERYDAVGHWDTVAVLPGLRGHGLARLMNVRALADLADTGIRHLFSTSSPANPHGVRTLMEAGFRPVGLVEKFGGRLRFLLYRPYPQTHPAEPDAPAPPAERVVAFSATDELARAFRDGWCGVGLRFDRPGGARLRMLRLPLPFRVGQR